MIHGVTSARRLPIPSEPESPSSPAADSSSFAVIEPSVNRYLRSCASRRASRRRNHSSAIAACSFSSSRLCSRMARSSSSSLAAARWSYQSIASSSSMIDTVARWRSIVAGPSLSGDSCKVALDPAMRAPPISLLQHVVRGSRPSNLPADLCRDVLDLEVLVDALVAALAAEPRLLHPSEGPGRVRDQPAVEPNHARFQSLDHAERPVEIAGVDVRDEAELGDDGGVKRVLGRHER